MRRRYRASFNDIATSKRKVTWNHFWRKSKRIKIFQLRWFNLLLCKLYFNILTLRWNLIQQRVLENQHQHCADEARCRQCYQPCINDWSEKRPVHLLLLLLLVALVLPPVHPTDEDHTPNNAVCARNRYSELACQQHCSGGTAFDRESTGIIGKLNHSRVEIAIPANFSRSRCDFCDIGSDSLIYTSSEYPKSHTHSESPVQQ